MYKIALLGNNYSVKNQIVELFAKKCKNVELVDIEINIINFVKLNKDDRLEFIQVEISNYPIGIMSFDYDAVIITEDVDTTIIPIPFLLIKLKGDPSIKKLQKKNYELTNLEMFMEAFNLLINSIVIPKVPRQSLMKRVKKHFSSKVKTRGESERIYITEKLPVKKSGSLTRAMGKILSSKI